ncbi:MAG: hypothetical protein ABIG71_01005 [Candidatus Uhrbacteria bacterium]
MRNARYTLALIPMLLFLGAGCISFSSNTGDGGIFLSRDRGDAWEQRGAIPTVGGGSSLANTNIRSIVQDPADPLAFYLGTDADGAFYSWDGGGTWQSLGAPFARARVEAVALHPTQRCSFLVAAGQKVFRSDDCGRNWSSSDFEVAVTALAIDPSSPGVLYAGNARGDLLKSTNGGGSWLATQRLNNRVMRILAQRVGTTTVLFAATQNQGIFRSTDSGNSWQSLREALQSYAAAFEYRELILAPKNPGVLFYASKYGVLRSNDSGGSWSPVPLLTAPGTVDISSIAVNPNNTNDINYATTSTFYRTADGGQTWESKKLPTSRQVSALAIDSRGESVVWMGTRKVKK